MPDARTGMGASMSRMTRSRPRPHGRASELVVVPVESGLSAHAADADHVGHRKGRIPQQRDGLVPSLQCFGQHGRIAHVLVHHEFAKLTRLQPILAGADEAQPLGLRDVVNGWADRLG